MLVPRASSRRRPTQSASSSVRARCLGGRRSGSADRAAGDRRICEPPGAPASPSASRPRSAGRCRRLTTALSHAAAVLALRVTTPNAPGLFDPRRVPLRSWAIARDDRPGLSRPAAVVYLYAEMPSGRPPGQGVLQRRYAPTMRCDPSRRRSGDALLLWSHSAPSTRLPSVNPRSRGGGSRASRALGLEARSRKGPTAPHPSLPRPGTRR